MRAVAVPADRVATYGLAVVAHDRPGLVAGAGFGDAGWQQVGARLRAVPGGGELVAPARGPAGPVEVETQPQEHGRVVARAVGAALGEGGGRR